MRPSERLLQNAHQRARTLTEALTPGRRSDLDALRLAQLETEAGDILALLRSARLVGEATRPGRPDQNTKRATLIAWLYEAEGATRDEILAAFDWKPGTLSAVLSGLRRDGYQIDRSHDRDAGCSRYRILTGRK